MLRAIIADDEELSVRRLVKLLADYENIEVCATFLNPREALEYIQGHSVEVVFLDISMPVINGITLAGHLQESAAPPDIVFVTGYDEYAVKAFEVGVSDYLLKPVTPERIALTIKKLEKRRVEPDRIRLPALTMFNGFKLSVHEYQQELRLRSPKTEELLAYLVYMKSTSRDEVAEVLWSGLERTRAFNNLGSTLYYIRKAFSKNGLRDCIVSGKQEIRIEASHIYCDVYEFEHVYQQVRSGSHTQETFLQAERLYAGDFLKGKDYQWAGSAARRLEKQYIQILEAAAQWYRKHNQPNMLLRCLTDIIQLDALREDIHAELIRLYVEFGRKNEAVRQYQQLEMLLLQELGVEPDPSLKKLVYDSML